MALVLSPKLQWYVRKQSQSSWHAWVSAICGNFNFKPDWCPSLPWTLCFVRRSCTSVLLTILVPIPIREPGTYKVFDWYLLNDWDLWQEPLGGWDRNQNLHLSSRLHLSGSSNAKLGAGRTSLKMRSSTLGNGISSLTANTHLESRKGKSQGNICKCNEFCWFRMA